MGWEEADQVVEVDPETGGWKTRKARASLPQGKGIGGGGKGAGTGLAPQINQRGCREPVRGAHRLLSGNQGASLHALPADHRTGNLRPHGPQKGEGEGHD